MRFSVRNITVWIVAMVLPATAAAQAFSLDSCRNMALSNNKAMQISESTPLVKEPAARRG